MRKEGKRKGEERGEEGRGEREGDGRGGEERTSRERSGGVNDVSSEQFSHCQRSNEYINILTCLIL